MRMKRGPEVAGVRARSDTAPGDKVKALFHPCAGFASLQPAYFEAIGKHRQCPEIGLTKMTKPDEPEPVRSHKIFRRRVRGSPVGLARIP